MTGVPVAGGSPAARRRELGVLLRGLRILHGLTIEQVAGQLGVSTSKVSRLESGHRGAREDDIARLCELLEVDDEQRGRLAKLAREGRQRAKWQPAGLPYSEYVGLEAEATSISDYGLGVVPGLLQTGDYARAVARSLTPSLVPSVVERRVAGRMARQALLTGDRPPRFVAVVDESVLHRTVGNPSIMRTQLEHLLDLGELPSVTLRVIPYDAGALPSNNKFIMLGFSLPDLPDLVYIEELTGERFLDDPDEVEVYNTTFRTLLNLAAAADVTREIISSNLANYAGHYL